MDSLFNLAVDAGLPGLDNPNAEPFGGFSDEDLLAAYVPGYAPQEGPDDIVFEPQDVGPVTLPSQVPDAPVVSIADTPLSPAGPVTSPAEAAAGGANIVAPAGRGLGQIANALSQEAKASYSGYSPAASAMVQSGPELAAFNQRNAAIDAKQNATASVFLNGLDEVAQDENAAIDAATKAQTDFDTELAKQRQWFIDERGRLLQQQQQMESMLDGDEEAARADYLASLQQKVNPGALWGRLDFGGKVSMGAAAFIHDFLGAKGIKTSAMDTWNSAVNRDIQAQVTNIENAQSGFKNLWDMTVAKSRSKQEAFARMRGYYLETAELQIDQHMMAFKAPLAQANGMKAKAAIRKEKLKNYFEVVKYRDEESRQLKQQSLQQLQIELQNAQAKALLAARNAAARRDAAATADPYQDVLRNSDGEAEWEFNKGIKPEEKQKFRDLEARSGNLDDLASEARTLMRKYKGQAKPWDDTRFAGQDAARLRAVVENFTNTRALILTGQAATDAIMDRIRSMSDKDLWGQLYQSEGVLAQLQRQMQNEMGRRRQNIAHQIPKGDPRRQTIVTKDPWNKTSYTDAKNTETTSGYPHQDTPSDTATKALTNPATNDPAEADLIGTAADAGVYANSEWRDFGKENPGVVADRTKHDPKKHDSENYMRAKEGGKTPSWAVGIAILAKRAAGGDGDAKAKLDAFAGVGEGSDAWILPDGATDANSDLGRQMRKFAQYELSRLSKLAKELDETDRLLKQAGDAGVLP